MAERVRVRELITTRATAADRVSQLGVGCDVAAGTDDLLSAHGMEGVDDRSAHVHRPGSGARCDPQLQHRRIRVVATQVPAAGRRSSTPTRGSGSSRSRWPDRPTTTCRLPFSTWSFSELADYLVA